VVEAIGAVLSVFPLDAFVETPVWCMEVDDDPKSFSPVQSEVQALVDTAMERDRPMAGLEMHDFYDRAKGAFTVVATTDLQSYGDFIPK